MDIYIYIDPGYSASFNCQWCGLGFLHSIVVLPNWEFGGFEKSRAHRSFSLWPNDDCPNIVVKFCRSKSIHVSLQGVAHNNNDNESNYDIIHIYMCVMWVRQCHKPAMTGNGWNPIYKNGDDLGMVSTFLRPQTTMATQVLKWPGWGVESGAWTRDGVKPATLIIYIIW